MKPVPIPKITFINIVNLTKKVNWNVESNECWIWDGAFTSHKLGARSRPSVRIDKKGLLAARIIYYLWFGKDPGTLFVCHTCDNASCVNPAHLWLGTHTDNMIDMASKGRAKNPQTQKTHCPQGHEYNSENTYYGMRKGCQVRQCRICGRERKRKLLSIH